MQARVSIMSNAGCRDSRVVTSRRLRWALATIWLVAWLAWSDHRRTRGADITWQVTGTGDWNIPSNWSIQTRVPAAGDTARLNNGGTATISSSPPAVDNVDVGQSGSASLTTTVSQSAGALTINNLLVLGIGSAGPGVYTQSGGTVNLVPSANAAADQGMWIGEDTGTSGNYTLSGGTLNACAAGGDCYVGVLGSGTVTQSGSSVANFQGTATDSSALYVGFEQGGVGQYNLAGTATLHAYHQEEIGYSGNGTFTQTGGTHTVDQVLTIADLMASTGSYSLQGGTLNANSSLLVGNDGNGIFTQTGGTANVAEGLDIQADTGTGVYNLKGGSLNVVSGSSMTAGWIYSGGTGGTFNFTGGTLKTLAFITDGNLTQNATDNASTLDVTSNDTTIYAGYDLNGGTKGASLVVGSGHTLAVQGELSVQGGTVTLTQSGGAINVSSNFDIANGTANGTFNLSGGSVSFGTGGFNVADQGGTGTLNLNGGGTVMASTTDDVFVANGAGAAGTVNQTGGTLQVRSGGTLHLTNSATAVGVYHLKGGTLDAGGSTIARGPGNGLLSFTGGTLKAATIAADMFDVIQDAIDAASTLDATANSTTINVNDTAAVSSGANVATINVGAGQSLTMAAGKALIFGNQSRLQGSGTLTGGAASSVVYGSNLSGTFTGAIGGSLALAKSGASTLTLSGANSYTGGTAVSGGTLATTASGSLGASSGSLSINSVDGGATVLNLGNNQTVGSLSGTVSGSGSTATLNIAAGSTLTVNQSAATSFGGATVNSGTLDKAGTGSLRVGTMDGSGTVIVEAGSSLTANHIIQMALIIGGTSGSPGQAVVAPSDASGNSLAAASNSESAIPAGLIAADAFTPSGISDSSEPSAIGTSGSLPDNSPEFSAAPTSNWAPGANSSAVPEPPSLALAALAIVLAIAQRIRFASRNAL
jgi:fibronectin-binding autotransporter adhesin